jgi:hypothetical protein
MPSPYLPVNQDWDIKPRSPTCAQCLQPFEDGQEYISALLFTEGGYQRQDYCQKCQAAHPPERTELISQWKGVFHLPPPPAPEPLNRENVERMLRDLMEQADASRMNVIYILAVMLERRRILVEKDVQQHDNGRLTRIYEHRHTGETFLITDPMLDLDRLEQVRQEVLALLESQAPTDTATPDTTAPNAAAPDPTPSGQPSKTT